MCVFVLIDLLQHIGQVLEVGRIASEVQVPLVFLLLGNSLPVGVVVGGLEEELSVLF